MHVGSQIEQVYLCCAPVDFRKSISGLSALVEQKLGLSPFGTALYAFVNRGHTKIKILYWHRNGFCLWMKWLEQECFSWPKIDEGHAVTYPMSLRELQWLLEGFDLWAHKPHKTLHYESVS